MIHPGYGELASSFGKSRTVVSDSSRSASRLGFVTVLFWNSYDMLLLEATSARRTISSINIKANPAITLSVNSPSMSVRFSTSESLESKRLASVMYAPIAPLRAGGSIGHNLFGGRVDVLFCCRLARKQSATPSATLRVIVKRILRKYGYPPDKRERATQTVLEQAEVLSETLVTA
jgi:Domain of unknown function (DUF3387)